MSYTDEQMIIAAKIAYFDWDQDAALGGGSTVKELLEVAIRSGDAEQSAQAQELLDMIMNSTTAKECANWIIKDVRNDQVTTGMYACVIETGDREAMIAFRGSESFENPDNLIKDWIVSDVGLANSILTPQQMTAERYMRYIYETYGDQYDSFSLTGHSLGGNLAAHATITAPDGMRDKIDRCVNLDGPGFSQNYMIAHEGDIEKSKGLIDHYQWSWCGALLNPVPGENYQTISARTPEDQGVPILWRHDMSNVEFDENGNVMSGDRDWLAKTADPIAKLLDIVLFTYTSVDIAVIINLLDMIRDGIEDLWESWKEALSRNKEAEFEIDLRAFYAGMDQMQGIDKQLREISTGVANIQKQLAFHSAGTVYWKMKLWALAGNIESDGDKVKDFYEKGCSCGNSYEKYEAQIAGTY